MKDQIISIKQARKLLGKEVSSQLSDIQVFELIVQLDYIATLAIKDHKNNNRKEK